MEDCNWRTVNGTPVCFKDGEDPKDSIDKAFNGKDKISIKKTSNVSTPPSILKTMRDETPESVRKDIFNAKDNDRYYLSQDGEFVKGGKNQHGEALRRYSDELGVKPSGSDWEDSHTFMQKTGMVRVSPMSDNKIGFDVVTNVSHAQLERMRGYEKDGYELQYDIKYDKTGSKTLSYGTGFKAFATDLKKFTLIKTESSNKYIIHIILLKPKKI